MYALFAGREQAIAILPRILALLLGGAGFIYGKRAGSVVLTAFILALRLWNNEKLISSTSPATDLLVIIGLGLGLIGVFASHKFARLAHGQKDSKHIDANVAASFVRISGAAGLSFGPLLWMFSMAEIGGFTAVNSTNALLIILFAWQTLKRQLWAAVAQVILALGMLIFGCTSPGGQSSVFSFFPLFLLLIHALGVIGIFNLKTDRRYGNRKVYDVTERGS